MKKMFLLLFSSAFTLTSCGQKSDLVQEYINLPTDLKEVSGLHYDSKSATFWTLEDSGNANALYQVNKKGEISHTLTIVDQKNNDWEELTADTEGNLYIGDFGNNKNKRTDLAILKINKDSLNKTKTTIDYSITFDYPEQKSFPPADNELLYDAEAFFYYNHNFYIFTKNRSTPFDGASLVYKIPNQPGHHKAQLVQTFKTCHDDKHCVITGAAISPDQSKFVLLSHDKIWLINNFNPNAIMDGKIETIKLKHNSQKESIAFADNNTIYIADEVKKRTGGKIYSIDLNTLKSKP